MESIINFLNYLFTFKTFASLMVGLIILLVIFRNKIVAYIMFGIANVYIDLGLLYIVFKAFMKK